MSEFMNYFSGSLSGIYILNVMIGLLLIYCILFFIYRTKKQRVIFFCLVIFLELLCCIPIWKVYVLCNPATISDLNERGDYLSMARKTEWNCTMGSKVFGQILLRGNLPEDYYYYGKMSPEYMSELGEKYLSKEDFQVLREYLKNNRWVYDCMAYGQYCKEYNGQLYPGDFLNIYVNRKAGFFVIWGVGPNLKQDINQEVLDEISLSKDFSKLPRRYKSKDSAYSYYYDFDYSGDVFQLHRIKDVLKKKDAQFPVQWWELKTIRIND